MTGRHPITTFFLSCVRMIVPRPDSRAFTLVFLVVSVIAGGIGGLATSLFEDHRNAIIRVNDAFRDESRALEPAVANYVQHILNNQSVDGEPTQSLINNLIRQAQFVEDAARNLPPRDRHLANEYQDVLIKFENDLPESKSMMSMQKFWADANAVFVIRNKILRKLDEESAT